MENQNSSYSVQIGKTTFIVCVKPSETAKKPIEKMFKDMCRHEVTRDFLADNLRQPDEFRKITENLLTKSSPKAPDTVHALVLRSSSTCLN